MRFFTIFLELFVRNNLADETMQHCTEKCPLEQRIIISKGFDIQNDNLQERKNHFKIINLTSLVAKHLRSKEIQQNKQKE